MGHQGFRDQKHEELVVKISQRNWSTREMTAGWKHVVTGCKWSMSTWIRVLAFVLLLFTGSSVSPKAPRWGAGAAQKDGGEAPVPPFVRRESIHDIYEDTRHEQHGGVEWLQAKRDQQPYLSVVVVMRNDEYGSHFTPCACTHSFHTRLHMHTLACNSAHTQNTRVNSLSNSLTPRSAGGNLLHRFERTIADLAEAAHRYGLVSVWNTSMSCASVYVDVRVFCTRH